MNLKALRDALNKLPGDFNEHHVHIALGMEEANLPVVVSVAVENVVVTSNFLYMVPADMTERTRERLDKDEDTESLPEHQRPDEDGDEEEV